MGVGAGTPGSQGGWVNNDTNAVSLTRVEFLKQYEELCNSTGRSFEEVRVLRRLPVEMFKLWQLVQGSGGFASVGVAVAIIVITAMKLHNVKINWNNNTYNVDVANTCLLGSTNNGANLCYTAYAASGISIIATGVLSILQCCTCRLCGLGNILDAIFAAAGTAMWAAAGVVFNHYNALQNQRSAPAQEFRASISILSFVDCALFGLMFMAAVWSLLSMCCCKPKFSNKGSLQHIAPNSK
eukprot:gene10785-10942_t